LVEERQNSSEITVPRLLNSISNPNNTLRVVRRSICWTGRQDDLVPRKVLYPNNPGYIFSRLLSTKGGPLLYRVSLVEPQGGGLVSAKPVF
jgi:hypothetical protein